MAFDLAKITDFLGIEKNTVNELGVVGVDMGSSSIKVVQLKRKDGVVTLETYGELQLGPYANTEIGRATQLDAQKLTEALVDIVREASVTSKNAFLAIPYSSSFVTVFSVPQEKASQLSSMVPIEARKYIPVPISEVSLDWFPIPEPKGRQGDGTLKVLLAAIHKEALQKYQGVIKDASLNAGATEIEIFSTLRSSVDENIRSVVVLDIGAATSKLYVVEHGIVQRSHSIPVGGQDLTIGLSRSLELGITDAEELKRQAGILDGEHDARVKESLVFSLERILRETKRLIGAHEQKTGTSVQRVILTGGGSVLRGLAAYAGGILEREVVLADPFKKVTYPAFLEDTLREAGPSFAVSLGVALRGLEGS